MVMMMMMVVAIFSTNQLLISLFAKLSPSAGDSISLLQKKMGLHMLLYIVEVRAKIILVSEVPETYSDSPYSQLYVVGINGVIWNAPPHLMLHLNVFSKNVLI